MQFLHPWMLMGLALVPVAVLLHVFRAPGRRHEVPSLALWREVLGRATPESTEKLRRFDWLLLLEILVITLLVLGLAWPVVWTQRPRRCVGIIYDNSASMKTVDPDGKMRFEKAKEALKPLFDRLSRDDEVLTAGRPDGATDASLEPEKLLSDGLAVFGARPQAVFLVTDNPPHRIDDARVRVLAVGGPSRNAGIVAFSGACSSGGECELFVRAVNFAGGRQKRTLVVANASKTLASEEVALGPGGVAEKVFKVRLEKGDPVVRVRLEPVGTDGLAADDEVAGVVKPLAVVAVGKSISPAYARLFGGPVFEGTTYLEAPEGESAAPDALLIAEGVVPKSLGAITVVVNPPAGEVAGIAVANAQTAEPPASPVPEGESPLLAGVNLSELKLAEFRALTPGPSARPLMRVSGQVVAAESDVEGAKVVVLGFDPAKSGWTLKPSFVVFWANVLAEARKASGAGGLVFYRTGDIAKESGVSTQKVGVQETRRDGRKEFVAVNLLSEIESDNRPSPLVGRAPAVGLPAPLEGKSIPLGPWLCLAAAVLAGAWWHFRR